MHRNHSLDAFLGSISGTKEAIEALVDLQGLARTTDLHQLLGTASAVRFREAVKRTRAKMHSRKNLELAAREGRDHVALNLAQAAQTDVRAFVLKLLRLIPELESRISDEVAQVADELQSERILLESILKFGRSDLLPAVCFTTKHFEEEPQKLVLRGRFATAAYTIQFRVPAIMRDVKAIVGSSLEGSAVTKAIAEVVSIRLSRKEVPEEVHLLVAVFHAAMGNYDIAIDELSEGISDPPLPSQRELLYLRAVLHRARYDLADAFADCSAARHLDPDDPRYAKDLGLLVWYYLHESPVVRADVHYTIDDAINPTIEARDTIIDDENLAQIVLNNLAFYYLEKYDTSHDRKDLISARETFSLLEQHDESSWEEEFYATRGFLRFQTAVSGVVPDRADRSRLLSDAQDDVKRALRIMHLPPFIRRLGEGLLVRIGQELLASQ